MTDNTERLLSRSHYLEHAVGNYLAHLAAYERGAEHDGPFVKYWREQMELLIAEEGE